MSEKQPEALLSDALCDASTGYDEWRVQSPDDGSYCIRFSWKNSLSPEREAHKWLADHKSRSPDSQYAGYVVEKVRVLTQSDRLMQKAAAELRRQHALLEEMAGALRITEEYLRDCVNSPNTAKQLRAVLAKWEASK